MFWYKYPCRISTINRRAQVTSASKRITCILTHRGRRPLLQSASLTRYSCRSAILIVPFDRSLVSFLCYHMANAPEILTQKTATSGSPGFFGAPLRRWLGDLQRIPRSARCRQGPCGGHALWLPDRAGLLRGICGYQEITNISWLLTV